MYFTSSVMPGARAVALALRARLCCAPTPSSHPPRSPLPPTSSALRARWRVCPTTGQRQQRWGLDDRQEPPSRGAALYLRQVGLMLGLHLRARTHP